jgi:uncharacterized LabA/DUF88 family protein
LVHTKYFTARVNSPADKVKRQSTYLEALQTLNSLSIFYGKYQSNPYTCRNCGFVHNAPQEKMTDVNIAMELMQDAFQDAFDTAILISADSDLIGPVAALDRLFPAKRIVVACPPGRFSQNLCNAAGVYFTIGRGVIAKSLFPNRVPTASGYILQKPLSGRDRLPATDLKMTLRPMAASQCRSALEPFRL